MRRACILSLPLLLLCLAPAPPATQPSMQQKCQKLLETWQGRFEEESFHWLVAPSSTVIQTSPAHSGLCEDPEAVLEHLVQTLVRV